MAPGKSWSRTWLARGAVATAVVLTAISLGFEPSMGVEPLAAQAAPAVDSVGFLRFGAPAVLRSGPDAGAPVVAFEYQPTPAVRSAPGAKFVTRWDEGFTANEAARRAFEAALDTWAREISSPIPIVINARMASLGSDELAAARPVRAWRGIGGTDRDVWVVDALADAFAGRDLCAASCPGEADIDIVFNDKAGLWYFGMDGNVPAGLYDFRTTVLHEVAHGLGFLGSLSVIEGVAVLSDPPLMFDRFIQSPQGLPIVDVGVSAVDLTTWATSRLYFDGPSTRLANGSKRVVLETPTQWDPGSSADHLAEVEYPAGTDGSLMTPRLNGREAIHSPGPLVVAMLLDIGWEAAPAGRPALLTVLTVGNAEVVEGRRGLRSVVTRGRLSAAAPVALSVRYRTVAVTARAGEDFVEREVTTVIPAGARTVNLVAFIYGDRVLEPDETFRFEVLAFSGYLIGDGIGDVRIVNDDG